MKTRSGKTLQLHSCFAANLIATAGGDKVHVPLGAAILFDIYQSIPDAASLRDALREKYAAYSGRIESMQLALVPEQFVSSDFRFAVAEQRKRQDVLVLDTLHRHREANKTARVWNAATPSLF